MRSSHRRRFRFRPLRPEAGWTVAAAPDREYKKPTAQYGFSQPASPLARARSSRPEAKLHKPSSHFGQARNAI
jgi:hypothetical protein